MEDDGRRGRAAQWTWEGFKGLAEGVAIDCVAAPLEVSESDVVVVGHALVAMNIDA